MNENWILRYYQMIEDGTVTVGQWIRMLYEKIVQDLEDKVYFFDQKKANKAIRFFESFCHHSKGKLAPALVKLEPWQKAMLSCMFGLVDADGNRQYREVFVVVARKCGKSLLASGIAEYMVYADGERGADAYFIAPKLDQADIVFGDFWQSVSHEPDLVKITKKRKSDIYVESTNTSVKKVAFSEKRSDGYNPHLTVCDELAAWPGEPGLRQYGVMTSALGAREQPMILSITTANFISDGIYDDLFKRSTGFLKGNTREKRLLPFLYTIDDEQKWNDLSELQKSIPNLGVSVSVNYILEEIAKAEQSLSARSEFKTKFCCVKQNASTAWLNASDVKKCFGNNLTLDDFRGCYCLVGLDLSQTTDLTAAVVGIQRDGVVWFFTHFWLPEDKIEEATARDGLPYEVYRKRGLIDFTPGAFVDYHACYSWITSLMTEYELYPLKVGYDRYSAQYLVQDLEQAGFQCESVSQGSNLTGVLNDMEGMIKSGLLRCGDDNDLMKLHLMDAALKVEDETNRRRLVKLRRDAHIDGTAALSDMMCMRHNYLEQMPQLKNEG